MGGNSSGMQDGSQADGDLSQSNLEVSDYDEYLDGDISNWQSATALDDIRHGAEKEYGIPFTAGPILGWSGDEESGYSLIIGYQYNGKKIARVIQSTNLPTHAGHNMRVEVESRAQQAVDDETDYDSRLIEGIGLVAWKVNTRHELDPTSSLHPGKVDSYPETYIWVLWYDGVWTWETRSDLQQIMQELTGFQVDLLIYRMATSQDADYRESLTRKRPSYLLVSPVDLQERGLPMIRVAESSSVPARDPRRRNMESKPNLLLDEPLLTPDMDCQSTSSKAQSKPNSKSLAPNQRNRRDRKATPLQSPHRVTAGSMYPGHPGRAELLGVVRDRLRCSASQRVAWEDDF